MAQGDKSNLLGVAYASVNDGKISGLSLCIAPTPDAAIRSGIYPGLNEVDPDLNEKKDQVIITEEEFQPKKKQFLDLGKETYQITDYVHDEVVAFCGAMNPKGKLEHSEDEMYSTERLKLESYNPEDAIPVATFFYEKYSPKKAYFYVAAFTEPHWEANHQEVYSLFSILWDKEWSHWQKIPEYCCSVISEEPQPPLHKEAAKWMLKKMTTKGSGFPDVDFFLKGKFELLI